MTKFQLTVLALLVAIGLAVFCLIGLVGALAFRPSGQSDNASPPPQPASVDYTPTATTTKAHPTSTPKPALADFDKIISAFEYQHNFTNWRTAPGIDMPVLTANNEGETGYIRIYGNPVQRVQLEVDYSLQGSGAAALINEVIVQTIPADQQQAVADWIAAGGDAKTSERRFGDRTASWLAGPETWLLTVRAD